MFDIILNKGIIVGFGKNRHIFLNIEILIPKRKFKISFLKIQF